MAGIDVRLLDKQFPYNDSLVTFSAGDKRYVITLHELFRAFVLESSWFVDDLFRIGSLESHVTKIRVCGDELRIVLSDVSRNVIPQQNRVMILGRYFLDSNYNKFCRVVGCALCYGHGKDSVVANEHLWSGLNVASFDVSGKKTGKYFFVNIVRCVKFSNKLSVAKIFIKINKCWHKFRYL